MAVNTTTFFKLMCDSDRAQTCFCVLIIDHSLTTWFSLPLISMWGDPSYASRTSRVKQSQQFQKQQPGKGTSPSAKGKVSKGGTLPAAKGKVSKGGSKGSNPRPKDSDIEGVEPCWDVTESGKGVKGTTGKGWTKTGPKGRATRTDSFLDLTKPSRNARAKPKAKAAGKAKAKAKGKAKAKAGNGRRGKTGPGTRADESADQPEVDTTWEQYEPEPPQPPTKGKGKISTGGNGGKGKVKGKDGKDQKGTKGVKGKVEKGKATKGKTGKGKGCKDDQHDDDDDVSGKGWEKARNNDKEPLHRSRSDTRAPAITACGEDYGTL